MDSKGWKRFMEVNKTELQTYTYVAQWIRRELAWYLASRAGFQLGHNAHQQQLAKSDA